MSFLSIQNVVKSYENKIAVNGVSFDIPQGCIYGLLGPNGAGKTSLIRIITTITRQDSGSVFINGEKLNEDHTRIIGYMPEERGLYKKMEVGEQLIYLARLRGLSKIEAKEVVNHWFEKFGVMDWLGKKVTDLSKGMQQKVQFVATVMHKPKLIILDEPFSGLDPINANLIEDEIVQLRDEGASIIFSTHRMEQVEEICDRMVLINQGKNVLEGDVSEIKQRFRENLFEVRYSGTLNTESLSKFGEIGEQSEGYFTIKFPRASTQKSLLSWLVGNDITISVFREILPSINNIFIRTVNEASLV